MDRIQHYAKPLFAISLAVIFLLSGATIAQARRIDALNGQIYANYARALYEGAELMRGVEVNLRKLTVSASGAQLQTYLNDIARQAQGAESAMTSLPFTGDPVQAATKAINQMSDYAVSLSNHLARGGAVTDDDIRNIDLLIASASSINAGLGRMIDKMENDGNIDTTEFEAIPVRENPTSEAGEYPTLIYDGPFSDASEGEHFKALNTDPVTVEQAAQTLTEYMGAERVDFIRPDGESSIPIGVYEFRLRSGEVDMSAAVTKQGGHVLYVLPNSPVDTRAIDIPTCISNAVQFLQRNGYGHMAASYYYHYQNILTINFAAMQDDVLLYPDLVKVQVSMADGSIIGTECANYLKNHVLRSMPEPQISKEEAIQRINSALMPEFARLALIPINTREVLTYEIAAKDRFENQYLIYIDAATGQERQIYQLISNENGTLTE